YPSDSQLLQNVQDLVIANHILYDQNVVDGFGHVSLRHPGNAGHFLLARSMAPALVEVEDIVTYDLSGTSVYGDTRRSYVERYIHSEIYRVRPDVMAIVHSHSHAVIPFSVSSVPLRPVFHMAGFLNDVKRYDIRQVSGRMTDMLVSDADLGQHLACTLGEADVALMRGHGSVVV